MTININTENSAFLFIDIQEKLINMLEEKIAKSCEKNVNILAKTSKILNIKSVVTEQYPKGLGETIYSVKESLSEYTNFVEKTSFSAFDETKNLLKEKENIFVFGIETHICVFQTVIDLLKNNYNVFVVKNACASRKKDEYKTAISLMEKEGAKIITTEMVLFEMLKSLKHPNFKEVQSFIK